MKFKGTNAAMKRQEAIDQYRKHVSENSIYDGWYLTLHFESPLYLKCVLPLIESLTESDEPVITDLDRFKIEVMDSIDQPLNTEANLLLKEVLKQEELSMIHPVVKLALTEEDELHAVIDLSKFGILTGTLQAWSEEIANRVELIEKSHR